MSTSATKKLRNEVDRKFQEDLEYFERKVERAGPGPAGDRPRAQLRVMKEAQVVYNRYLDKQ